MAKAPTRKQLAEELCKKFPDTPTMTLARRLYDENKFLFANLELARSSIRLVRGTTGRKNKKLATVPRTKQKAGWVPECPPSAAEEWKPFELTTPCRVLSLSDIHVPYHSKEAVEAAVKHGKKLNPTVLLLNGDTCDFYSISRWERDPKRRNFKAEVDVIRELLSWLRGQFPKAQFIFKDGNHEERYDVFLWNKAPELFDLEHIQLQNILDFEKFGIERVTDKRPILAGKLPILHGHEPGQGIVAPVNQARGMYLRLSHSSLTGHGHRTSTHCEPDMFDREVTCYSQGCLCNLKPLYRPFNKWNWGHSFVDVAKDGQFNLSNFRINRDYEVRTA